MVGELVNNPEKKISRAELKRKLVSILDDIIDGLVVTSGFVSQDIWFARGDRKTKLQQTADIVLSKIDAIDSDVEYAKIRQFLAKFNKGNYSIRNLDKLKEWVFDVLVGGDVPVKAGEIILKPGKYSLEDFKKIIEKTMSDMSVYQPGSWVDQFVDGESVVDGVIVVESVQGLKDKIQKFIDEMRIKVEKN